MVVADHLSLAQVEHIVSELESRDIQYVLERAPCGCWTVISFTNLVSAMLFRTHGLYPDN